MRLRFLAKRATLANVSGDPETAARYFEQLRKDHRALGNVVNERSAAVNLAEAEHAAGRTERAIAIVREILQAGRVDEQIANMGSNLAGYLVWVGDLAGASEAARSVFAALAREPDHPFVATALEHVALVRALEGDLARAAALEGFAEATIRRSGLQREATEKKTYERLIALLHEGLAPDDRIDCARISPLMRDHLRDVFRAVASVQWELHG